MKNGKTRLQRVQVLASGKYKFVKNLKKAGSKAVKTVRSRSRSSKVSKTGKKNGGILGNLSMTGALEDLAIGYLGMGIFEGMGEARLPMTRVVQGISGHALDRRGKGRLQYGILDLVDVYLAQGAGIDRILDELKQSIKLIA